LGEEKAKETIGKVSEKESYEGVYQGEGRSLD
jgi:hypothetical protein